MTLKFLLVNVTACEPLLFCDYKKPQSSIFPSEMLRRVILAILSSFERTVRFPLIDFGTSSNRLKLCATLLHEKYHNIWNRKVA